MNKISINIINKIIAVCAYICILCGCSSDETFIPDSNAEELPMQSMPMRFKVKISQFDTKGNDTRAASLTWQNGAVVYLQFHNGKSVVRGYADYDSSRDAWTVQSWAGSLATADKCEVYYFDGASTTDKKSVTLDATMGVYADTNGTYSVSSDGEVTVEANLVPLTSRVRFSGASGLGMSLMGVTAYSGYDAANNRLITSTAAVSRTVASDGYTPYAYCTLTNTSSREITITNSVDGSSLWFQKSFPSTSFRIGESGLITIPTEATNKGWEVTVPPSLTFTVTGNGKTVTFTMKRVGAGTFEMGSTGSWSDEQPIHSVTLTKDYYMGETEVTQALWFAVMGQSPTTYSSYLWSSAKGIGDNYPAYFISYEDCQSFLSALNSKLSSQLGSCEQFRFPTEAEWEFAAKGGTESKGYTYSGSNSADDVAWYYDNSGTGTHGVKTKSPNELGLYDMSGNLWEWCFDWYGNYASGAQTDPTGPSSGSKRVHRGGSWNFNISGSRVLRRNNDPPSYRDNNIGFRLAFGESLQPMLNVGSNELSFTAAGGSETVNITTNRSFTVSSSASWLTVTPSSGSGGSTSLTVTAAANTETGSRTATITIMAASLSETITVIQDDANTRTFTVTGNGKTVTFKMIKVEGGTFQMGDDIIAAATPFHTVSLTRNYYMGETEVTNVLWYAVMGTSPSNKSTSDYYPVESICYSDCQNFLSGLNSKLSSQLASGEQFRFPTEAEWEFAAKGGNMSKGYTYAGSDYIDNYAWYSDNSNSTTHQVKTKAANELGLYDMSGNVWEWCYDWYGSYSSGFQTNPTGPTSGSYRVIRGGCWNSSAIDCLVTNRNGDEPTTRFFGLGLRLCLGAPIEQ